MRSTLLKRVTVKPRVKIKVRVRIGIRGRIFGYRFTMPNRNVSFCLSLLLHITR